MTTLITGAGVVGLETARQLNARGKACVLADIRKPQSLPDQATFVELDVTDSDGLARLINTHGITEIVHTAAVLSNGMRADPVMGLRVNLMGTANVLDVARRLKLGRVITISSSTVFYSGFRRFGTDPIPEDCLLHMVSERPRSLYAMTKIANEQMGHLFSDLYDVNHIALRFSAVVGGDGPVPTSVPGQLFRTLINAARSGETLNLDNPLLIWGGAEEFVDLRDCAGSICAALDAPDPKQRVYNIGHPHQWTLNDIIAEVAQQHGNFTCNTPQDLETGFAGFPFTRSAPSSVVAAKAELGFECRHDLADSIAHWW